FSTAPKASIGKAKVKFTTLGAAKFTNVGPGVLFALFGIAVLTASVVDGIKTSSAIAAGSASTQQVAAVISAIETDLQALPDDKKKDASQKVLELKRIIGTTLDVQNFVGFQDPEQLPVWSRPSDRSVQG